MHKFTSETWEFEEASSERGQNWNYFSVYQGITYRDIKGHLFPLVFWSNLRDCTSSVAGLFISSFPTLMMSPKSFPEGNLDAEPALSSYASLTYCIELDM